MMCVYRTSYVGGTRRVYDNIGYGVSFGYNEIFLSNRARAQVKNDYIFASSMSACVVMMTMIMMKWKDVSC